MSNHPRWFKLTLHHLPAVTESMSILLFEIGAGNIWKDQPDETDH